VILSGHRHGWYIVPSRWAVKGGHGSAAPVTPRGGHEACTMAGIELDLGSTYGEPNAGDPIQYDELRIEHDQGAVEIVVYNHRAVHDRQRGGEADSSIQDAPLTLHAPTGLPGVFRYSRTERWTCNGRARGTRHPVGDPHPDEPPRKLEPFCVQSAVSVMDLVTAAMRVDPRTGLTRIVAVGRRFQVLHTVSSGR
jgi:hypothetical protein